MLIDVAQSNPMAVYQTLVAVVTPRPIAWVTTSDRQGIVNLAPLGFFNVFGANPPVVVFSPTLKRDGSRKDTLRNVEATGEFVTLAAQRMTQAPSLAQSRGLSQYSVSSASREPTGGV